MTSTHIPGKGVFLDAEVASMYWNLMRVRLAAGRVDGGRVAPPVRMAQEALRAAVLEMSAMSADGRVSGLPADIAAGSTTGDLVSTQAMADRLGIGPRHARRLASEAGIESAARDAWWATDVDRLATRRRRR